MAILRTLPVAALLATSASAQVFLSPADDILLPPSKTAKEPLKWLGGNSPYFAGPNVNGVENVIPEGCVVDQVAYVARHGSRYPDTGAYNEWTTLYAKVCLSYLHLPERRGKLVYTKNGRYKTRVSLLQGLWLS